MVSFHLIFKFKYSKVLKIYSEYNVYRNDQFKRHMRSPEVSIVYILLETFSVLSVELTTYVLTFRGNVFLSTSDRPESRSVMPAGNYTVWSTVSSLMVRCPQTRPSEVVMTPSTPSSVKQELANTYPGLSLLIWNQLLSVCILSNGV